MRVALLDRTTRVRAAVSLTANVPAPVGGLNSRDSIVDMAEDEAIVLDNLFPRLGRVVLRGGTQAANYGTIDVIKTLMEHRPSSGNATFFAVSDKGIYDLTPVSATLSVALTNGYFNSINLTNGAGSTFLWGCNGVDPLWMFNGTAWVTPAVTGIANPATLIFPTLFKHRIMAIEKDSMNVWYLDIDAVQGPAVKFPFGNIFKLGGKLISITSWTLDSGTGPDDLFVAITSEGEVAVYQGTDPASSTSWSLVGVWQVGKPLGRRCFTQLAGDVLLLTESGVFPLSRILRAGKLNYASALSNKIQSLFTTQVQLSGVNTEGWEAAVYPQFDALIVCAPKTPGKGGKQFVMNTITGAWCTFSGWQPYCIKVYNNELYMGMPIGVMKCWGTIRADFEADVTGTVYQAYNYFGNKTLLKQVTLFRPIVSYEGAVQENWAISSDFQDAPLDAMFPRGPALTGGLWDVSDWDVTDWDTSYAPTVRRQWRIAAHQPGYALSLRLQFRTNDSSLDWAGTDYIFESGGAM